MFDDCKSLNDAARKVFGVANYTNREKVKKILAENGIDWREWIAEIKESKTKYCIVCGKKLEKDQVKFCSHSCSAHYTNTHRAKKQYCKECGKELTGSQKEFCSHDCQNNFYYKQYIERWKKDEESGLKGEYGVSKYIKRYLFEKYGCKCEMCGWGEKNEFTGNIPLEIHHKDGNYMNNKEENLQLLCPNCHSLTESYKSHNKNGRKGRKKYNK